MVLQLGEKEYVTRCQIKAVRWVQYYVVKSETLQSSHCLSIHVLSSIVVLNIFVFSRAKTRQSCSESLQSCHIAIGVDCECVLTTPLQSQKMTIITCPVDFDFFRGKCVLTSWAKWKVKVSQNPNARHLLWFRPVTSTFYLELPNILVVF